MYMMLTVLTLTNLPLATCPITVSQVMVLLQSYISRAKLTSFTLIRHVGCIRGWTFVLCVD